jgi:predicted porin
VAQAASQQIVGAAMTYNLSKRTTAYVWASYGDNFEMVSGAKTSVIGSGIQTLF